MKHTSHAEQKRLRLLHRKLLHIRNHRIFYGGGSSYPQGNQRKRMIDKVHAYYNYKYNKILT